MNEDGWYYLHTNGTLHWKRFAPESDSPFVRKIWPVDKSDRACAWLILIEGLALGANVARIRELSEHWHCDVRDLLEFIRRYASPTKEQRKGIEVFLAKIIGQDPNRFWDWLAATPKGEEPDWSTMPRGGGEI